MLTFAANHDELWPFRDTAKFCGRAIDLNLRDRLMRGSPGELNALAYKFGMPNYVIEQWCIMDNPHDEDGYRAVIQAMAEITTTARQRADDDFPLANSNRAGVLRPRPLVALDERDQAARVPHVHVAVMRVR